MKTEDIKIGMKIKIPTVKRTSGAILTKDCSAYLHATELNQNFLYIVSGFYNNGHGDEVTVGATKKIMKVLFMQKICNHIQIKFFFLRMNK
jgi:hypothetical protein